MDHPRKLLKRLLRPAGLACLLSGAAAGQTLDDVRDSFRQSLRDAQFAGSFSSVITLAEDFEFSGATYDFDDPFAEELSVFVLPLREELRPFGEDGAVLEFEAVLGYARTKASTNDLYQGMLPGLQTSVTSRTATYGGLIGLGPRLELAPGFSLTPLLNAGLARIENDADYLGPGSGPTRALVDGIAFNWAASSAALGTALRADWVRPLGDALQLELVGRYDLRWTETFQTDDPAQEFSARNQLGSLHALLSGPTPWSPWGHALGWRADAGYRSFLEGEIFGVDELVQLGAGLDLEAEEELPVGRKLTLDFTWIFGEDVTGWAVGAGVSF